MQLAVHPVVGGPQTEPAGFGRILAAGVAVVGAGVLVAGPVGSVAGQIQHRAVQLVNTSDWSDVLSTAEQNLDVLQQEFSAQPFAALTQFGDNLQDYAQLIIGLDDVPLNETGTKTITSGFAGIAEGFNQMLNGFDAHPGVPGLLDLPQVIMADLQSGDSLQAFSDFDNWLLDSMEITIKPLVPMATIPEAMLQNFTSVMTDLFGPESLWDFGKAVDKAFTEPLLGLGFQFSEILGQVQSDFADGDTDGAFSALAGAPAQLTDALLNGYQVPGGDSSFIGLLSAGGTLESLLVTWPERIAEDLTVGTADLQGLTPAESLGDLLGSL